MVTKNKELAEIANLINYFSEDSIDKITFFDIKEAKINLINSGLQFKNEKLFIEKQNELEIINQAKNKIKNYVKDNEQNVYADDAYDG